MALCWQDFNFIASSFLSILFLTSKNICLSYSVGVFKNGRVEIIANDQGNRITPSYVAFTPEGERLIGDGAKNQLTTNPENTVFDAKRLIGRTWDDKSVQHDLSYFPFQVIEKNKKPHVRVSVKGEQKTFAAEEISAMVLGKMKVSLHSVEMISSSCIDKLCRGFFFELWNVQLKQILF